MKKRLKIFSVALAVALGVLASATGCGSAGATAKVAAGYQPPFLPVSITIDSAGNISLQGDVSITTVVGTFFLEANVSKDVTPVVNTTLLIIEHRRGIAVVYTVYRIKSQQVTITLNGHVRLDVTNNRVFVNAIRAHVRSIVLSSPSTTFINSCLVGTWRDLGGRGTTRWDNHVVTMYGGGGNIDHISAAGIDQDYWGPDTKPLYGTYRGHRLKEVIRGTNRLSIVKTVYGNELQTVEDGWSAGSTNTYIYKGRSSTGWLAKSGTSSSFFQCTAHKLKWTFHNILDVEIRISRSP